MKLTASTGHPFLPAAPALPQASTPAPAPASPDLPQALPRALTCQRALVRGRIEVLQSALQILGTAQGRHDAELEELRTARLSLHTRLQSGYVRFLGDVRALPPGIPLACHGDWQRREMRRLLEEDLAWARHLPGDPRDLVAAIEVRLDASRA